MNTHHSRRDFLKGTAGLTFAFALAGDPRALIDEAAAGEASFAPSAWLTIGTDGTITIVSPAAEMGQGSFTTLPLILAEERSEEHTSELQSLGISYAVFCLK